MTEPVTTTPSCSSPGAPDRGDRAPGDGARPRGPRGDILRLLFWMRVALVGAIVLAVGPPLAVIFNSPLVANMFVIADPWSVGLVSAMSVIASWVCGLSIAMVRLYAPERMLDGGATHPPMRATAPMRLVGFSLLALPLVLCVLYSAPAEHRWAAVSAAAIGSVVPVLGGLQLTTRLWDLGQRQAQSGRSSPLAKWMVRRGPWLWAGYVHETKKGACVVLAGHWVATGLFVILLLVYAVLGYVYTPGRFQVTQPAALVYILLLFMMNVTFLAAVSFFLDRFRVPLLLALIGWNFLCLSTNARHSYTVYPVNSAITDNAGQAVANREPTGPIRVPPASAPLTGRPRDGRFKDTIVVVCASGGGIHAAAWTTRVLTWLNEDLGPEFSRACRFYSGVSGGSVGLMYFLDACRPGDAPQPESLALIRDSSDQPSLPSVAWGLAFPDFSRAWAPFIAPRERNRAWALELAWRRHPAVDGASPSLNTQWSEWVQASAQGKFPGVVFNAFEVTRGYRVLINTVAVPGAVGAKPIPALREGWNAGSPGADRMTLDMDVVTAARLSATFPYVTPISTPRLDTSRPRSPDGPPVPAPANWAIADGGYFDNAGIMTAVEWIRAVADDAFKDEVRRVVVLEIRAFQRTDNGGAKTLENWRFTVLGPVMGMLQTRTSSQIDRDDLDLVMLKSELAGRFDGAMSLEHVVFDPAKRDWPLSWQISPAERKALDYEHSPHNDKSRYFASLAKLKTALGDGKPAKEAPR